MYMVPINLGFYDNPIRIKMKEGCWNRNDNKPFCALMTYNCLVIKNIFIWTNLGFV